MLNARLDLRNIKGDNMIFLDEKIKKQQYIYFISINDVKKVNIDDLMNEHKQNSLNLDFTSKEVEDLEKKQKIEYDSVNPLDKLYAFFERTNVINQYINQYLPFVNGIVLKEPVLKKNKFVGEFKTNDNDYPVIVLLSNTHNIKADAISNFERTEIHGVYMNNERLSSENVLKQALNIQRVFKKNKIFSSDVALGNKLEEYIVQTKIWS